MNEPPLPDEQRESANGAENIPALAEKRRRDEAAAASTTAAIA